MDSSPSGWGGGEALGTGAPGTRLGIWPNDGNDEVEKGEGAGLRGGGVRITAVTESPVPCVETERPFSLT